MIPAIALLLSVHAAPATAATKTFHLDHASAEGFPQLLDRLVRDESPWVEPLRDHWDSLRGGLKADRERNALRAEGSAEALDALAEVVRALDVPRPQVSMEYRYVRVDSPADLIGAPAAPPAVDSVSAGRDDSVPNVRLAPGDWSERVTTLVDEGKAEVLAEGDTSAPDGCWATIYVGDPEADEPSLCLQARPVVMEGGALWLTLTYGALRWEGEEARKTREPDEVCVSCGPGRGDVVLVPELRLSSVLVAGQQLLLSGVQWHPDNRDGPAAPADEFLVLTARVEGGE